MNNSNQKITNIYIYGDSNVKKFSRISNSYTEYFRGKLNKKQKGKGKYLAKHLDINTTAYIGQSIKGLLRDNKLNIKKYSKINHNTIAIFLFGFVDINYNIPYSVNIKGGNCKDNVNTLFTNIELYVKKIYQLPYKIKIITEIPYITIKNDSNYRINIFNYLDKNEKKKYNYVYSQKIHHKLTKICNDLLKKLCIKYNILYLAVNDKITNKNNIIKNQFIYKNSNSHYSYDSLPLYLDELNKLL